MPTKRSRAISWIKSRKATPFYLYGIFCVRLNQEPSARNFQDLACGIDPGSKKEGFTLKSKAHTYLNIQSDTPDWIKDALKTRREMRRNRRFRKTPYRKCRFNRKRRNGWLPPSTKSRWAWKFRIVSVLKRVYPISIFVVEDINAETRKDKRKWNISFSPLQSGKHWFYQKLRLLGRLTLKQGYETKELRDRLGLKKSKNKLEEIFEAHCVDSWALAWSAVGGQTTPGNTNIICIAPIRKHRRQLHALQPAKGGIRRPYGGTRSMGLKRGSLVKHSKHGICYVGGTLKRRISLHCIRSGKRLCQNAKTAECKVLAWNTWRIWGRFFLRR